MEFLELEGENESDLSTAGYALLTIIREYERLLYLHHPENPCLTSGETIEDKVLKASRLFIEGAGRGELNEASLSELSKELHMLTLRVANLVLHLNGSKEVVVLPSKRNYLYAGETALMSVLEELRDYRNLEDGMVIKNAISVLKNEVARKADKSCEGLLEFRIVSILLVSLQIFTKDKQTISYLAQLLVTQEEIATGNRR